MKFKATSAALSAALLNLKPLINTRSTLPILSTVLFEAKAGWLKMSVNTLDAALTLTIDATIEEEGGAAILLSPLFRILQHVDPDAEVQFDCRKRAMLSVNHNGRDARALLDMFPASEFPPVASFSPLGSLTLSAEQWARVLGGLIPFLSRDETRYAINGVFLDAKTDNIKAIATDGRRLRMVDLGVTGKTSGILRPDFVNALHKMCTGCAGDVRMELGELSASAEGAGWRLEGRLFEGNYPNYRQVIPGKSAATLVFKTSELRWALAMSGGVASQKRSGVKIKVGDGQATFQAGDEERSADITIPASASGNPKDAAFNVDFLRAIVDAHDSEEITLDQSDELAPVRVDSGDTTSVLMPMRIS